MSKTDRRSASRWMSLPPDEGMRAGFGGVSGANRGRDAESIETLPEAKSASYGAAPGQNPAYGSRGTGDGPRGSVTNKTR